jgi:hypothetical protein
VPVSDLLPGDYADFARPILEAFAAPALTTRESDVAQAVWAAVQDRAGRLAPAGPMRWRWRRRGEHDLGAVVASATAHLPCSCHPRLWQYIC